MPRKKPPTTAARITTAREAAGLTRHGLAVLAGLDHKHIAQIEDGTWQPKPVTLRKIAVALMLADWRDLLAD